ncbi:putative bifunctional diguanylate cyclase/phosphodiesterase [Imhoffiella purpurea]|uniref:Diguanylate cyclase n=1 Tax=Imhoffiella purpurea TaxID=1249627 RepID=W9VAL3_9GAMM|nr:EAL domain-containing protein [Imhoffiella purpurea]EXJ13941.1 diguanylate cyclase [Imhoffiella purpurea]
MNSERSQGFPATSRRVWRGVPLPIRRFVPGLRARIVLLALSLAVLPLLLYGFSTLAQTQAELKSAANDRVLATARSLMDRIRIAVGPARSGLLLLRDSVDDPGIALDAKLALLESSLGSLPEVRALEVGIAGRPSILLLERPFKTRLDALDADPVRVLGAGDASVGWAERDPDRVMTETPRRIQALDLWLLPLSVPLREPLAGRDAGLTLYLDLTSLVRALGEDGADSTGGSWLLDLNGRPLFRTGSASVPPLSGTALPDLGSMAPGALLATIFPGEGGVPMLGAFAVLDFPPWILLVGASEGQAYTLAARMRRHLLLWLSICAAAGLAGALILAQRIGRPIREMALVADRVGGGDFSVRVGRVSRHDEIGRLGRRLDQMIEGLERGRRQLERLARQDSLTGLSNRRWVLSYLERLLSEHQGEGGAIAVLFVDLDRFKRVNDSLGHTVGDDLLKLVARRLSDSLGEDELVARLGGDEFLVVRRGVSDREAVAEIAARLIGAFGTPFQLADLELHLGCSLGIALAPRDGIRVAELITNADMAMYHAKEQGRGRYRFFDAELRTRAVRKLALDVRLRHALERGELEVYYQPQVETGSRRVVATEALLRWPDGRGGFVASPGEFIPLAEETGLILPLGDWVMESVCRQAHAWRDQGLPPLSLSFNVSSLQFGQRDFVASLRGALDRSRLDARRIGLELTESVLLEDVDEGIRRMEGLKEMGVQLMIDDFGTGYSSLAYLRRFPLDYLKVAQEFVRGLETNPQDASIVDAVIALSKTLGLKVIAEGVETQGQLDYLVERRCDLIQGFYFGPALPADDFVALLEQGPIWTMRS